MRSQHRSHTPILLAALLIVIGLLPGVQTSAQAQARLNKRLIDAEWQAEPPLCTSHESTPNLRPSSAPSDYSADPEDWTRLVFSSYRDGNWEIYRFEHHDNSFTAINLSRNSRAQDTHPRLNRTADQIVFATDRDRNLEIYRMDINGASLVRLTMAKAEDTQPFWSPDGQRISFASKRDGNWNIYVMNADGTSQNPLTTDPADDIMPSWSPDGTTIAWVRAGATTGAIWLMNADGSNPHAITGQLTYLQHPSWSPDGARLAFDYDRDGDTFNDLGVINADGSGLQPVSVTPNYLGTEQRGDLAIGGWSPEGDRLLIGVITYNLTTPPSIYNAFIGRVLASGGGPFALVFPESDAMPDMRSLDLTPPHTSIASLPAYSRAVPNTIQWSGADTGGSGMGTYDVQYRVGPSGAWINWQTRTLETSAPFTGTAGTPVSFRVRGRDVANNVEDWRTTLDGATSTTFYTWSLAGAVTDNRGMPIPAASLSLTPGAISSVATDLSGSYLARLKTNGNQTVLPAHAGYRSPPPTTLAMNQDRTFDSYLLPADSGVQNGGFEASAAQLTGWVAGGTLPGAVTTTTIHTGSRASQLGQPCAAPCLSSQETIPADRSGLELKPAGIAVDNTGVVHVLWTRDDLISAIPQIYYQSRSAAGVWSAAARIGAGTSAHFAIDGLQRLHVIWVTSEGRLIYRNRPASGGAWSPPLDLGLVSEAKLYADPLGRVHLLYYCFGSLGCPIEDTGGRYRIRTAAGVWLPERTTPTNDGSLTIGPDSTAYLVWHNNNHGYMAIGQPDGSLTTPEEFSEDVQVYLPQAAVDPQGVLYVVWGLNQDMYYVSRTPDGEWSLPAPLPNGGEPVLLVAGRQTLYLLNGTYSNGGAVYLRTKSVEQPWAAPVKLYDATYPLALLATDRLDRVHLLRDGLTYQATSLVAAGNTTLAQAITVPAAMHKPTLAFDYKLSGITPASGSRIDVTVTSGITAEHVFSTTLGDGWTLATVDMQRWAGQTISVTIGLRQAGGAPTAIALIDDVSLGSWLTPHIQQVMPQVIDNPAKATTITITGENFLATPSVRLNTTALSNIQRVDEHTIHATVPAGLKPGIYILWVTNPAGQSTVLPVFPIGKQIQLPLVLR